jgi:competence CoiA-like predicted nuclease
MAKAEISWKRDTPEGIRLQVYVQHVGRDWRFFVRERRFDQWQSVENPPLEDWLELLDSVRRRINRRLLRPEEEATVIKTIRERFPDADFD